jgi:hypothetical protein
MINFSHLPPTRQGKSTRSDVVLHVQAFKVKLFRIAETEKRPPPRGSKC